MLSGAAMVPCGGRACRLRRAVGAGAMDDGVACRCDGEREEQLDLAPPAEPLPEYARERVENAVRMPLVRIVGVPGVDLAARLARSLTYDDAPAELLSTFRGAGLDERQARDLARTVAYAVDEHARVIELPDARGPRERRRSTARRMRDWSERLLREVGR